MSEGIIGINRTYILTQCALLHITAPTGSTITLKKDSTTMWTIDPAFGIKTNEDANYSDYYYEVSTANYGSWTVTATKGSDTRSATVTVNANKQYDIKLVFQLYLFKTGTGLNSDYTLTILQVHGGVTYNSTRINTVHSDGWMDWTFNFDPKVNLNPYTSVKFDVTPAWVNAANPIRCGVSSTAISTASINLQTEYNAYVDFTTTATRQVKTVNVSQYTDSQYVKLRSDGGQNGRGYIYNVWLE